MRESAIPRACGAIALIDVMRKWGVAADLLETWLRVAEDDPLGTKSAKSYRLAGYAIDLGLQATILKCHKEKAWDALLRCARLGVSVIINHQARLARNEGHFSTLVSIAGESIVTDDPISRIREVWSRDEFLCHWTENDEISGHVLVVIRGSSGEETIQASSNRCPVCSAPLSFEPGELFNPEDWGLGGLWRYFYCQGCDASFKGK